MINSIKAQFFTVKFLKFIILGFWNTFFGMGVFFLLYYLFNQYCRYMMLVIIANILAITNAYIVYKLFVFRTKGNYLREYLKFYVVYGLVFVVAIALFPFFMEVAVPFLAKNFLHYQGIFKYKAYISQMCITGVTMFISYFGHEKFSYQCN